MLGYIIYYTIPSFKKEEWYIKQREEQEKKENKDDKNKK
jgi:hypothetical protein